MTKNIDENLRDAQKFMDDAEENYKRNPNGIEDYNLLPKDVDSICRMQGAIYDQNEGIIKLLQNKK